MTWQCDQMGHINSRHLYAAFDDATAVLFSLLGAGFAEARDSRFGWVDVHQEIEFLREVRDGQAMTIRSCIEGLGRSSVSLRHELCTEGAAAAAARMRSKTVRFDLDRRASAPLDDAFRARAATLLEMAQ
ncbi:thioesterase family protein [Leptolyngbya sp. 15MV]|nr:thioesterase family protein [Leptolyngbya sp. 15MV]